MCKIWNVEGMPKILIHKNRDRLIYYKGIALLDMTETLLKIQI